MLTLFLGAPEYRKRLFVTKPLAMRNEDCLLVPERPVSVACKIAAREVGLIVQIFYYTCNGHFIIRLRVNHDECHMYLHCGGLTSTKAFWGRGDEHHEGHWSSPGGPGGPGSAGGESPENRKETRKCLGEDGSGVHLGLDLRCRDQRHQPPCDAMFAAMRASRFDTPTCPRRVVALENKMCCCQYIASTK